MSKAIVPACEVWFQSDHDLQDLFNVVRVRARVHLDVVPREALIVALEEVLARLKSDSMKLLVKEDDDLIVRA